MAETASFLVKLIELGPARRYIVAALFIAAVLAPSFLQPATARDDGRIGVLYIGCLARSTPFWWMRSDPLFYMNFVQATLRDWAGWGPAQVANDPSEVHRMIRLYMPRTYRDLSTQFDVIILANANRNAVGPHNIAMLADGVKKAGMGLVMFGGWESFGGAFNRPDWGQTMIGQLLPTEDVINTYVLKPAGRLFLVIDKPNNEFMRSLPWDRKQPFMTNYEHNIVIAKPGASILAHVESTDFKDHPGFVEWQVEGGARVFAVTGEIIGPGSEPGQIHTMCAPGRTWKYAIDFGSNLMIYLAKRPVPQNLELVHKVRSMMFDLSTRKSLLFGLLDFCESFGANTNKIMQQVDDADRVVSAALPDYRQLRFEKVLKAYQQADKMLAQMEADAVKLKKRALVWVYTIEWLAVTSTALICGSLVWSLMIRKRLYREAGMTRMEAYQ